MDKDLFIWGTLFQSFFKTRVQNLCRPQFAAFRYNDKREAETSNCFSLFMNKGEVLLGIPRLATIHSLDCKPWLGVGSGNLQPSGSTARIFIQLPYSNSYLHSGLWAKVCCKGGKRLGTLSEWQMKVFCWWSQEETSNLLFMMVCRTISVPFSGNVTVVSINHVCKRLPDTSRLWSTLSKDSYKCYFWNYFSVPSQRSNLNKSVCSILWCHTSPAPSGGGMESSSFIKRTFCFCCCDCCYENRISGRKTGVWLLICRQRSC